MEKLYQYLWMSRMFGRKLRDCDGETLEVVDPGVLNSNAGPDFFNAKIRVGGVEWIGNVEIHVKASDWFRHNHDSDPAYGNVILHAVGVSDKRVIRPDGTKLPQAELTMPEGFFHTFLQLDSPAASIRCAPHITSLPQLTVTDWLESLAVERIQEKAARIKGYCKECGDDWQQATFITLARALGFGLNGEPFEMLARSIPLKILHHHSDNPLQLQAILFGQAAMLDPSANIFDEYYQLLCREYYFLARKYGLRPLRPGIWKYARTRPGNFPHRRIALLAKACENGFSLFSEILSAKGLPEKLRPLFGWELSGYWANRMSFDASSPTSTVSLSAASITSLMINVAAPLLYAVASHRNDPDLAEEALDLLSGLPPESNSITRQWVALGLKTSSALRSQAVIHLQRSYCDKRKCLYCRFGHNILKQSALSADTDTHPQVTKHSGPSGVII